jgi:hypothetical protein
MRAALVILILGLVALLLMGCGVPLRATPIPPTPTPIPPTPTPTVAQLHATIRADLIEYARYYNQYGYPRGCPQSSCDWRVLDLALSSWLPLHPVFNGYYQWSLERMRRSATPGLSRVPEYLGDAFLIERYLAGER